MDRYYTSRLSCFISDERLPLWVVYRGRGLDPCRLFHDHDYTELVVILHGPARHILDSREVSISEGDILLVHPGAVHAYDRTDEMELVNLLFDASRLPLPLLDGHSLPLFRQCFPDHAVTGQTPEPVARLESGDLKEAFRMIRKLEDELRAPWPGSRLNSLLQFFQILIFLARASGLKSPARRADFMIGDAIKYMNHHYAERVEPERLAKIVNMSPRSFFRHFYTTAGCSPIQYLLRLRLRHACDLLINSECTVTEVALQCGFCDSNYFCKQFRKVFAVSPRQYRLNSRTAGPESR